MIYKLIFSEEAEHDIQRLKRSEPQAFKKLMKLLLELQEHPVTGTGKPEMLVGNRSGQWSRRISGRHRLIYCIEEEIVTVLVLSAYGHYEEK